MRQIFLAGFIFISACELTLDNTYHNLPEKYKTNINDYDTILFKSKYDIDTMYVRKIYDATLQHALSGTSCKEPYEFWEFECLYYFKYHLQDNNCENWFDISKEYGECAADLPECEHAIEILYGIENYLPNIHFNNIHYQLEDSISNIIIDGFEYENVFSFKPKIQSSVISKLLFNYDYGILSYISDKTNYEIKNIWNDKKDE